MSQKKVSFRQLIKEAVLEVEPEARVILFGSRARGSAREDSDWDVLVLASREVDRSDEKKVRHQLFNLELSSGQAISVIMKSEKEWDDPQFRTPLTESIQMDGVLL